MDKFKANIRERAGNHLLSIMLLSGDMADGAKGKPKLAETALRDLAEILIWLTKSGKKQYLSSVRNKAIEKIKGMQVFCEGVLAEKKISSDRAAKILADVEEIRDWLDQRLYKTKSKS